MSTFDVAGVGTETIGVHSTVPISQPVSERPDTDQAAERVRPATRALSWTAVLGVAMSILGAALLGFVADVAGVGALQHGHVQSVAYAKFRSQLANSVAPTGPTDVNGRLLRAGDPVAVLRISALGVHEVIREGTSSGVLVGGPGHLPGTVLPGQAGTSVIFGRRAAFGGPFNRLGSLHVGSLIRVTTGQGVRSYAVTRVVQGVGIPPVDGGGAHLMLVTAGGTPYLPDGVLYAEADLQGGPAATPVGSSVRSLASADAALAGDGSAWTPLVLWGVGLLIASVAFAWGRKRWGGWQAWVAGLPVLLALGLEVANQAARLLPNLL